MKLFNIDTKNRILFACILMMCSLIVLRDILENNIPNVVFAILISVGAFFLKLEKFKIFLFFLFPFTCGIPGYTMLISIIALIVKSIGKVQIQKLQIFPTILIALLELFNNVAHVGNIEFSPYLSYISFTAVFFFLLFDKSNYKQSRECLLAFIWGTILVFIIIYYKMIVSFGLETLMMGYLRGAMGDVEMEEEGKLILNANSLAYISIVLISILLIGAKKLRISPILYYTFFIVAILSGMGSFSRTWMLLSGLILVVYLIYRRSLKASFSLIFVFGVIIMCFPTILDGFVNVMTNRINDDNFATGGSRSDIFKQYNLKWFNDLFYILFGVGVNTYKIVLHISKSIHNSIQQIYVCLGIVGLFIYIYSFFKFYRFNFPGKRTIMNILPFVFSVLFLQSIQFLQPYNLMLPLIPACYTYFIRE